MLSYHFFLNNLLACSRIKERSSEVHNDINEEHKVDEIVYSLGYVLFIVYQSPVESDFHRQLYTVVK